MLTDGILAAIPCPSLIKIIGGFLDKVLESNNQSFVIFLCFHLLIIEKEKKKKKIKLYENLEASNFLGLKFLGSGYFGKVMLVKKQDESKLFALKAISKRLIKVQNLGKYI